MQMQKYKKNVLHPNIWQFFFTDMTDVDDVFTRWLFYMPLIVVRSSFDLPSLFLRFQNEEQAKKQ
jgi:hypothetical protein